MKKKLVLTALVCMVAISLLACTPAKYKAGTYSGEGTKRQYGYETADVTVDQAKITAIVLHRVDANGAEVNYDEWTGAPAGAETRPNLKQIRMDLAQQMLQKQSAEVNAVTGATDSSKGWMDAVKQALAKAKK